MIKNTTQRLVTTALMVALGLVLPMAFHAIPRGGMIFLPMHIPVLLTGFLCGPFFGLLGGLVTPLLSSLCTGMPPAAILPAMLVELAAYGLFAGLFFSLFNHKSIYARSLLSLVLAMLIGRVIAGVANAMIFQAGKFSLDLWIAGAFVTALPGILIQLVLIPVVVVAIGKSGLSKNQ